MEITKKWLEERNLCEKIVDWFTEQNETNSEKIIEKLLKEEKIEWANQLSRECIIKNEKRDGLCREWYKNGQLRYEHNFKDDKKDGLCRGWYKNGQLMYKDNYKDGKENGLCREWWADGQLMYDGITKKCTVCNYEYNSKDGKKI